jgi:predicted dehydrogenase
MAALKVGLLGLGNISPAYITGVRDWDVLELVAGADFVPERAEAVAREHDLPRLMTPAELLSSPDIDIVVNLTPPAAHAETSLRALENGKHVYSEKPLAIRRSDARRLVDAAAARGLRLGCAPDTFLFSQHQTARRVLDEGLIGEPVAAVAHMVGRGPEGWHPNPDFFYQPGGGPLLDMGPYYITCLVNLLGPVASVMASTRISFPEREAGEAAGFRKLPVTTPTHYAGILDFASGPVASTVMSFDVWRHELPGLEIYGSEGSLRVPDPNGFDPRVVWRSTGWGEWEEAPNPYPEGYRRGIGLADMAQGILTGRPHRASGALACHVLDVMEAYFDSATQGARIAIETTVERPTLLPVDLPPRQIDA